MVMLKNILGVMALLLTLSQPALAVAPFSTGSDSASPAFSAAPSEFLPPQEAFRLRTSVDGEQLRAEWDIAPDYYLYKDRFAISFTAPDLAHLEPQIGFSAEGEPKEDEYFGLVEVFYEKAVLTVDIRPALDILAAKAQTARSEIELAVTYQGCAEAGLCYPPQTEKALYMADSGPDSAASVVNGSPGPGGSGGIDTESASSLASILLSEGTLFNLGLFFLLGIGLAFTPCVFPMIPILSSIIAGQQQRPSTPRAFMLSLSYVLGMAVTYAIAGVVVGYFGAAANIQSAMQNPFVLSVFSVIFVVLALAMFGLFELQLPAFLRDRLNSVSQKQSGGHLAGVAGMGAVSALVVSPCVTAPLTGVLIYISTTQNALYGGLVLLVLALGMGLPLLLLGTGGGRLLPKAGAWMNRVKAVFGIMLLGVAVWLLERILPGAATLALWGVLAGVSAVYLGAFDTLPAQEQGSGVFRLRKGLGLVLFIYAVTLLLGAAAGSSNPFSPLERFALNSRSLDAGGALSLAAPVEPVDTSKAYSFRVVKTLAELDEALATAVRNGQPAMLDFYADWCISCKVMERQVFPHPNVSSKLQAFALIKADITDNDVEHKAMLDRFRLFGPPALLFFSSQGRELENQRIVGEIGLAAFSQHLADVLLTNRELTASR
ncbi:protein-disulfide reductase DsbD [Allohahella marinimesophila]|uniref:Thiol:disulfide interchange protein DsbD n=1 Tax=Allohahella marinimesophila TaxID=1054972 RepID=A0ABP7NM92_9GAMM